jgi:hypothetical protein
MVEATIKEDTGYYNNYTGISPSNHEYVSKI